MTTDNKTVDLINDYVLSNTAVTKESLSAELNDLFTTCQSAISEPAKLGVLLRNAAHYKKNLTEAQFSELSSNAEVLLKDLTTFSNTLSSIKTEQEELLKLDLPIDVLQISAFDISNSYTNWTERFVHVVIPVATTISSLIQLSINNESLSKATPNENVPS